jgi:glyoxylase I family protein
VAHGEAAGRTSPEYNARSVNIQLLHHVSLTVSDLERSKQFYRDVLRLNEIARPPFPFPGAWFQVGDSQHVHLIVHEGATFRGMRGIDTRDSHFAVRVRSYREAVEYLQSLGYREDAGELDLMTMKLQPHATAGFPQIYILDPDRHVIEINAESLD